MAKVKELHRRWSKASDYRAAYGALDAEFELAKSADRGPEHGPGCRRTAAWMCASWCG
jgi:hypothetical protein